MTRFIWRNWWRHKQRFILLLVGILIISSGLTFLSTLTESNFGTVSETLEKKWKASYDIVVRPQGTRSVTEEDKLFEPNFLSGLSGGISTKQFEQIKAINNVDIAAPLAIMGYTHFTVVFDKFKLTDMGVYRITHHAASDSGVNQESVSLTTYLTNGPWSIPRKSLNDTSGFHAYGVNEYDEGTRQLSGFEIKLLVGIDPEQEARLVGLDKAIIPFETSRYFNKNDVIKINDNKNKNENDLQALPIVKMPILVSSVPFDDTQYNFKIERLDLPFNTAEQAKDTMETVKKNGARAYLDTIPSVKGVKNEYHFDSIKSYQIFIGSLTGTDPYTGNQFESENGGVQSYLVINQKSTPLNLSTTTGPFKDKWNFSYKADPLIIQGYNYFKNIYRPVTYSSFTEILDPNWIGFYDPNKLTVSKDPTSQTPLETYRASSARLVLDSEGNPVNPPQAMQATMNPFGLLTSPPSLLTTIDAATSIYGDQAISAIRIKVADVNDLSSDNQAKVEKVAHDIERETGLIADVIFGSAPQPVLIEVPQNGDTPALGWIEQTWIKVGEATGLFNETQMGFSLIMILILLVAVMYVQASQLVSLLMRRREFAVLLAIGLRPLKLKRMVIQEAIILGLFASAISGTIGLVLWLQTPDEVDLSRIGVFALLGLVIYVLGALWPAWLTGKIRPYETMRVGEISKTSRRVWTSRGIFSMAINHFFGKIGRYALSIISIALPTALLVLLLFITFRLKGVLYTSWIGEYISVQIGSQHFVAIGVTLVICVLTTSELIWQNVTERKPELFLLKSIGWRSNAVRMLILYEGGVCGLLSGLIGYLIGLAITGYMYGEVPLMDTLILLPVCIVPMIVGLIAAWIPAEFAVRGFPAGTTGSIYSSSRSTQRWFFASVTMMGLIIITIVSIAAYKYIPKLIAANTVQEAPVTNMIKEEPITIGIPRDYVPETVPNGSKAEYDISLDLNSSGQFTVKATIDITNDSAETWDKLVFYMIPNVFTEANKPTYLIDAAKVDINEIKLAGKKTLYDLHYDTLTVPLSEPLQQGANTKVDVSYTFTVPEQGIRFSKEKDNYYLAQFYPMLANYNKGWIKEDYYAGGESYLTDFTNFKFAYKVPTGYTVVSSADDEIDQTLASGQFEVERVKELFVAIVKDRIVRKKTIEGTEIRVFGATSDVTLVDVMLDDAVQAFQYYQQTIGLYPRKQLDIFIEEGAAMEYPGIVTIGGPTDDFESKKHTLQHEIAHQWFYGVVSNDPYNMAYLDEGFTEFSATLLRMDGEKFDEDEAFSRTSRMKTEPAQKPSNLPLPNFDGKYGQYVYLQPTLKLWELFSKYNSIETAKAFLKAYYATYAYKQVDTREFIRFTKAYFLMEDDKFFESWLKL